VVLLCLGYEPLLRQRRKIHGDDLDRRARHDLRFAEGRQIRGNVRRLEDEARLHGSSDSATAMTRPLPSPGGELLVCLEVGDGQSELSGSRCRGGVAASHLTLVQAEDSGEYASKLAGNHEGAFAPAVLALVRIC